MHYKFTFEDGSEALLHYGVKGMKWGVWNADTRSRYLGQTRGTKFETDETHSYMSDRSNPFGLSHPGYEYSEPRDATNINSGMRRWTWDTDISEFDKQGEDYGEALKQEIESLRMEPEDLSESFTKVNSLYGAPGYDDNCMGCAISMIMRARGLDVEADSSLMDYTDQEGGAIKSKTMSRGQYIGQIFDRPTLSPLAGESDTVQITQNIGGTFRSFSETQPYIYDSGAISSAGDSAVRKYYRDAQASGKNVGTTDGEIWRNFMADTYAGKQPEGSYGIVRGSYQGGGGHILTYKIEDGTPVCYDGQSGKKKSFYEATKDFNLGSIGMARLDDAEINYRNLGEWGGVRPHERYYD